MFARIPGKGITLEMYIRNTQVNKNIYIYKKKGNFNLSDLNQFPEQPSDTGSASS